MTQVNTVLGPLDSSKLGFTLMHEHVLSVNWAMRQSIDNWFDRDAVITKAVQELKEVKRLGVTTIVDATPINLGRDIEFLKEVAEKAEIQLIAATGFYWVEEPIFKYWEPDQLVEFLLPDIEKGIQGTDAKAAIIKCATDEPGITPINRKLLQVAARLHRATGVPITTHTSAIHKNGLDQQALFLEEGVDLSRVIIGHTGDTDDIEYIEKLLAAGSYVGMDRFGLDIIFPHEKRIDTLVKLCRAGYAERIVLSHDAVCYTDWFTEDAVKSIVPKWNLRFISEQVISELIEKGVSKEQIFTMTVTNPSRIFYREQ